MSTDTLPPSDFSDAELKSVAGTVPSASGSPTDRFVQEALAYYRGWLAAYADRLAANGVPAAQALVLLYSESPAADPGLSSAVMQTPVRAWKTSFGLENGLAVCTENMETIFTLIPSFAGVNEAMSFCAQYIKKDRTFVIIPLVQHKILVHHAGLEIEEWCNDPLVIGVETKSTQITPASISQALDRFHSESVHKPGGHVARLMWVKKHPTPKLVSQAELHVQSVLLLYLKGLYYDAGATVDEELSVPDGRVDIRIFRSDVTKQPIVRTTTMLELKVLYPDRNQAANEQWGLDGISQAKRYQSHDTDATFACLYDARQDKTDHMPRLQTEADLSNVLLRRYEMDLPKPYVPKASKLASNKTTKKTGRKIAAKKGRKSSPG